MREGRESVGWLARGVNRGGEATDKSILIETDGAIDDVPPLVNDHDYGYGRQSEKGIKAVAEKDGDAHFLAVNEIGDTAFIFVNIDGIEKDVI